jgi:hypothetical protein
VISVPIAYVVYKLNPDLSFAKDTSIQMLMRNMVASFLGFVWGTSLIVGCSLTLTAHAEVMYTATGVYILFFSFVS